MSDESLPNSEFLLYQTEDGRTRIQCRLENETLWLTQAQFRHLLFTTFRVQGQDRLPAGRWRWSSLQTPPKGMGGEWTACSGTL